MTLQELKNKINNAKTTEEKAGIFKEFREDPKTTNEDLLIVLKRMTKFLVNEIVKDIIEE